MKNQGLSFGLYAGLGTIMLSLLLYLVSTKAWLSYGSYLNWLIYIAAMVYAAKNTREDLGGYMTWGQSLLPTWLVYVVGSFLGLVFFYVMLNFIDPGLNDVLGEIAKEQAEKMMRMFGAPEDQIEQAMADMENQDFSMGIGKMIMGYVIGLIFPGFVLAAVISLIMKRKKPEMI